MSAHYGVGMELVWRRVKPVVQLVTIMINSFTHVSDIFSGPLIPDRVFSYFIS